MERKRLIQYDPKIDQYDPNQLWLKKLKSRIASRLIWFCSASFPPSNCLFGCKAELAMNPLHLVAVMWLFVFFRSPATDTAKLFSKISSEKEEWFSSLLLNWCVSPHPNFWDSFICVCNHLRWSTRSLSDNMAFSVMLSIRMELLSITTLALLIYAFINCSNIESLPCYDMYS